MVTFLPLGGANEIGASCYYLNIEGTGIVVDCGTHPRKTGIDSLPQFDLIKQSPIDVALISHAHQDHIEALPYLVQQHPYVRIVATPQTRAIAELTLHNSVHIIEEQVAQETSLRAYTHEEIDLLIQSIEWKAYDETFTVNGYRHHSASPITATFYDAGHILGSTGILLQHDNKTLYYTGDINIERQMLFPGATLPQQKVDVLVIECTLGSLETNNLPSRGSERLRLAKSINRIIEQGGSVLLPVFALGKTQELLGTLWQLMNQGTLARTDIFTGGLGRKISTVYDRNRYVVPYNNTDIVFGDISQNNLYEVEQTDQLLRKPCIVLASSGMMIEGTISYKLAQHWLSHSQSAIFTVGYMDPETPGSRVRQAKKGDMIQLTNSSQPQNVRCEIDSFRFSAHNDREGLLSIVQRCKPSIVILVHGDHQSIDWMGYTILQRFPSTKVYAAEIGKQISLFE